LEISSLFFPQRIDIGETTSTTVSEMQETSFQNAVQNPLHVLTYGCETWSLSLRDEPTSRAFERWVLMRIFGPKRDEVDLTGGFRKMHNEDIYTNLYYSPNILMKIKTKRLGLSGPVRCMGEMRDAYKMVVGKPEGKRPLGRPWLRLNDNFEIYP
jgi:hypothetical protein